MRQPLTGVRVVDLTRARAGPMCTALLADLGENVLTIEALPRGDGARLCPPHARDRSLHFASVNRNKGSLAIDPRSSDGMAILRRLIAAVGGPLWMDGQPSPVRRLPPELGADTRRVRRDLGLAEPVIDGLVARGVVRATAGEDRPEVAA